MKKFSIILILFFCGLSHAQEAGIKMIKFVKKDTVQLRWATTSAENFLKGLKQGYEIQRVDLNNQSEETIIIPPFNERKESLKDNKDSSILFLIEMINDAVNEPVEDVVLTNLYFMLSLAASNDRMIAVVTGTYYEDVKLVAGNYTYRIKFKGDKSFVDELTINTKSLDKNPSFKTLTGESRMDLKEVYLTWEAEVLNANYGGYWILKSEDKINYKKINKNPVLYFTSEFEPNKTIVNFVDTSVVEGKTYYYKIQAINHFADKGEESNQVEVYIQKQLTGLCKIDTIKRVDLVREIYGTYTPNHEGEKAAAFILYRSAYHDSLYEFVDKFESNNDSCMIQFKAEIPTGDRHFFKLAALSEDGDTMYSYPTYYFTLDQEPPAEPTDFKGEIDSLGVATLTWTPPADKDIQGYRIYRTNALHEEFVEITNILKTDLTYNDTLYIDNLSSEVYYRIRTVDLNYNNSTLTPPIKLLKPDTIPPVPPAFKSYKVENGGIALTWANSKSDDVIKTGILKQSKVKEEVIEIVADQINFVDTTCEIGMKYSYTLFAEDEQENRSFSKPLNLVYEVGFRAAPNQLKAEVDRAAKTILLTWNHQVSDIYAIQIYRSKNEQPFRLVESIHENTSAYTDQNLSMNNIYRYKINMVLQSGKSTKMSEVVEVVY